MSSDDKFAVCRRSLEVALSGIDLIDGRLERDPGDVELVVSHFVHFAEHNCIYKSALIITLNYTLQVTTNSTVLTRVATILFYLIPTLRDLPGWINVYNSRAKRKPEHTEQFRKRVMGAINGYLIGTIPVTECVRVSACTCGTKCHHSKPTIIATTRINDIHAMD